MNCGHLPVVVFADPLEAFRSSRGRNSLPTRSRTPATQLRSRITGASKVGMESLLLFHSALSYTLYSVTNGSGSRRRVWRRNLGAVDFAPKFEDREREEQMSSL